MDTQNDSAIHELPVKRLVFDVPCTGVRDRFRRAGDLLTLASQMLWRGRAEVEMQGKMTMRIHLGNGERTVVMNQPGA